MKNKIKKTIMLVMFLTFLTMNEQTHAVGVALPHETCISDINGYATIQEGACANGQEFMKVMEKFVASLMGITGAVTVAMIVYGGFRYIMAAGDPRAIEEAKSILFYSGLGLFVVLSAYTITSLVFGALI